MFPTCKNSQKWGKNQKSTDKHSSFDGLIQEDIDLLDILKYQNFLRTEYFYFEYFYSHLKRKKNQQLLCIY